MNNLQLVPLLRTNKNNGGSPPSSGGCFKYDSKSCMEIGSESTCQVQYNNLDKIGKSDMVQECTIQPCFSSSDCKSDPWNPTSPPPPPSPVPSPVPSPGPSVNPCPSVPSTWSDSGSLTFYKCLLNNSGASHKLNFKCFVDKLALKYTPKQTIDILIDGPVKAGVNPTTVNGLLTLCNNPSNDPGQPHNLRGGSIPSPPTPHPSPSPSPSPGKGGFSVEEKIIIGVAAVLCTIGLILLVKHLTAKKV